MALWVTLPKIRKYGRDVPKDDEMLTLIATAAQEQLLAFLELDDPAAVLPETIPAAWQYALILHTLDLYASAQTGDRTDQVGGEGYQTHRPRMSGTVRGLLAPYRSGIGLG